MPAKKKETAKKQKAEPEKKVSEHIISQRRRLTGIGGWLILPILGLVLSLIFLMDDLIYAFSSPGDWFMTLLGLMDIAYIAIIIFTLVFIFKRDIRAPKFAIASLWVGVFYSFFLFVLISDFTFVGNIIGALIWTAYFQKSRRVRYTFRR